MLSCSRWHFERTGKHYRYQPGFHSKRPVTFPDGTKSAIDCRVIKIDNVIAPRFKCTATHPRTGQVLEVTFFLSLFLFLFLSLSLSLFLALSLPLSLSLRLSFSLSISVYLFFFFLFLAFFLSLFLFFSISHCLRHQLYYFLILINLLIFKIMNLR